jgi:hypothetical protein
MALTFMASLAAAVILATITETMIGVTYRESAAAFYAAEAGLEFAIQELRDRADWSDIRDGKEMSVFIDGAPPPINLELATADVNALETRERPYVLYGFGTLTDLIPPVEGDPSFYIAIWISDRSPIDSDDIVLGIAVEAFGPIGSRRGIEATVGRAPGRSAEVGKVEVRSWRELL